MTTAELDIRARELREINSTIDALTKRAEEIKNMFKETMIDRGEEEISGNGWKASWKTVSSNNFDGKALKAADPVLYAKYTKITVSTRFIFK